MREYIDILHYQYGLTVNQIANELEILDCEVITYLGGL